MRQKNQEKFLEELESMFLGPDLQDDTLFMNERRKIKTLNIKVVRNLNAHQHSFVKTKIQQIAKTLYLRQTATVF